MKFDQPFWFLTFVNLIPTLSKRASVGGRSQMRWAVQALNASPVRWSNCITVSVDMTAGFLAPLHVSAPALWFIFELDHIKLESNDCVPYSLGFEPPLYLRFLFYAPNLQQTGLTAPFVHLNDFWYLNFFDTQSHYSYLEDLLRLKQIIHTWTSAGIFCTRNIHFACF